MCHAIGLQSTVYVYDWMKMIQAKQKIDVCISPSSVASDFPEVKITEHILRNQNKRAVGISDEPS